MLKKNVLFILINICLYSNLSYSQVSCQTALSDQGYIQIPLPAPGTVAQPGPDYGCVTMLSRPVWGYIMSCDTTQFLFQFEYDIYSGWTNVYSGIVVWGPFKNKTDACNNLTSNNIVACADSVLYPGTFIGGITGIVASPCEYYYYMMSTSDTIAGNSYTSLHAILQGPNFSNYYPCYECNNEVSQFYYKSICLVTFDTTSQKTKIVWEKIPDTGIDGYILYRGVDGSPIFDSIAYISESVPGEYIDIDSHPLQYGEYYRLQPIDSCGHMYGIGEYLPVYSSFLQTTPGSNSVVNLNWNYGGASFISYEYEQVIYIHRGTTSQNMSIIDTIPFGLTSYSDINAPAGQLFYAVERRKLSTCNPNKLAMGSGLMSKFSNTSGVVATGLDEPFVFSEFKISPNPANNYIQLEFINSMHKHTGFKITDLAGRVVIIENKVESKIQIDISSLHQGIYLISEIGTSTLPKRFVKL